MDYHQNPNKLLSQLDGNGSPEMEYLPVLNMTNAEATQYATLLKENKVKEAGEYLNSIMETLNVREGHKEYAEARRAQVGTGDRSERIRTYNFPQGRVTDHRIGFTLYSLDKFMLGDMDEMISALQIAVQNKLLENIDE